MAKSRSPASITYSYSLFWFITILIPSILFLAKAQNSTVPVQVGVIVNLDKWVGKMELTCLNMALSDFYGSHAFYNTRLVFQIRHSDGNDVVGAAAAGSSVSLSHT